MCYAPYNPSPLLQNGVAMTIYTSLWGGRNWEKTTKHPEPPYKEKIFIGAQGVPIFGLVAIPENAHSTIIATYGITGTLDNQWFLKLLGRKAYAQGYAVVLFDWRAHGKTAELSPTLTSDGLYEGEDFVRIAASAKDLGCPAKFWFTGFSLGGQLALWAVKAVEDLLTRGADTESITPDSQLPTPDSQLLTPNSSLLTPNSQPPTPYSPLTIEDIGGAAVMCPSLDSVRSLAYLIKHPVGKYIEAGIARKLNQLAWKIHDAHPGSLDPTAIERAKTIWGFDHELVIEQLGFPSVEAYYNASSALPLLPNLTKPTLIIYAADDPFFEPALIPELEAICAENPMIDLILTNNGGHVGYVSSKKGQRQAQDPDPWWAWNRILQWFEYQGSREI
ncbi:MAG: alpha/beta fold hydrolase [Cyanomargarita calcarea GSE-NOS-MK-12-04C]|uniref:Alpha/beta fold hydrolase n=1 Tax=Cyanomargarita calcarea GSE-NOS-MK-12-04C TaxID=2839659 RepID=A0A951UVP4_9CYAN|nr:alpha/beta fold hydrolase [Cyanomargarita calcarea GSE-NOS-MK-12-04C]